MLAALTLIVIGCGEASEDAVQRAAVQEVSESATGRVQAEVARLLEIEYKTLVAGAALARDKAPLVEERLKCLKAGISGDWTNDCVDDNSTRDACLKLEAQLSALAIGRGIVGSADAVRDRMRRLQSLLKHAGYDFDERGFEQTWDPDGKPRAGYKPLLP
jgi:hypothetical protein